jgi:hypothetical protein
MDPAPPVSECLNGLADGVRCGCADDCKASNAMASCVEGRCVRRCDADHGDCNSNLALGSTKDGDGCETDLRTSDSRCGDCSTACTTQLGPYVSCENKQCRVLEITPTPLVALGRCLDLINGWTFDGNNVQLYSCGDRLPQQLWAFTATGEVRGFGNKCLDVEGPNDQDDALVQVWECVDVPQQRWELNALGQLVAYSGKCLEVRDGTSVDGQTVWLQKCRDIPAQRWTRSAP